MNQTVTDNTIEACYSIRDGRWNPKNMWCNDVLKAALGRKEEKRLRKRMCWKLGRIW